MSAQGPDRGDVEDLHLRIIERAGRRLWRPDRFEGRDLLRLACLSALMPLDVVAAGLGAPIALDLLSLTLLAFVALFPFAPPAPIPAFATGRPRSALPRPFALARRAGLPARVEARR